jgi:hypothetical protein
MMKLAKSNVFVEIVYNLINTKISFNYALNACKLSEASKLGESVKIIMKTIITIAEKTVNENIFKMIVNSFMNLMLSSYNEDKVYGMLNFKVFIKKLIATLKSSPQKMNYLFSQLVSLYSFVSYDVSC